MYILPELTFSYDALDPYLDGTTLRLHHQKHHGGYVDQLNAALECVPEWRAVPLEELLLSIDSLPIKLRDPIRHNGGGHFNHSLFWSVLTPRAGERPHGALLSTVEQSFGSFENFKERFTEIATNHFASGWVWISVDKQNNLAMETSRDHESPLSRTHEPIFAMDLWEHSYYLQYQNRRKDYLSALWNVVNWAEVSRRLEKAKQKFSLAA